MTHQATHLSFPAPEHDHGLCEKEAMDRAQKAFEAKSMKLTPLRQSVFEQISGSHRAVGAYDIL